MNARHAINCYREAQTLSAQDFDPAQLLDMTFESLQGRVVLAKKQLLNQSLNEYHKTIDTCVVIIQQALMESLDMNTTLGGNLFNTYNCMIGQLISSNLHKNPANLDLVWTMIQQLKLAFRQSAAIE